MGQHYDRSLGKTQSSGKATAGCERRRPVVDPGAVLEKCAEIKRIDMWIPAVEQCWLFLPHCTQPSLQVEEVRVRWKAPTVEYSGHARQARAAARPLDCTEQGQACKERARPVLRNYR